MKEDIKIFYDIDKLTEEEIFKKSRLMNAMYNKRIPLNINKKLLLYAIYDKLEIEHPSHHCDDHMCQIQNSDLYMRVP